MSGIEISLGATRHPLSPAEAEILRDWLTEKGSTGGETLATLIRDEEASSRRLGIRLGLDDIAALRSVLCETEISGLAGLEALQAVLCPPS
ncbi:MAG: hypothetical protein ACXWZB_01805 [Gaiellaceae bacterium]